jgi:hypothetical protein
VGRVEDGRVVSAALGVGLIALDLVDVFLTVLDYDGSSLLNGR